MWLWIVATLVAYYIKGLCGFANSLIFSSIMGFNANNINITPVELLVSFPSNMIMTWKNRKSLKADVYIPLSLILLGGSVVGAFLLKNIDARLIKIFFGIVVVLIGIEMYFREYSKKKFSKSKIMLLIIGTMSGILCGLFGIGALLAAYIGRVSDTNDEFKANINAVFIVENAFRIILYIAIGVISFETLKNAIFIFPFMLIGLCLGMKSSDILDEQIVKKLVIVMLILSGLVLIIKNI